MDYEECKKQEEKPVKLTLKNGDYFFGTYVFKKADKTTVSFTDRKRKTFPILIEIIALIEPVDKIIYIGDFQ